MKTAKQKRLKNKKAYALVLALVAAVVLLLLGAGLLYICYGVRVRAAKLKRETIAMLAAEAGYEQAIFWMSQQTDILGELENPTSDAFGTITFDNSYCDYEIRLHDFIGARPVFRILSTGYSGALNRVVDVFVVQKITGWDMGMCRIPSGMTSTEPVFFANGEIINIPIHINEYDDSPDYRDIYITGSPQFLQKVEMGESKLRADDSDKYSGVMGLFTDGIYFDQPNVRITDETAVQSKVERFRKSIIDAEKYAFVLTPVGTADVPNPHSAVQLEFFVESGVGKVRITNNCTVQGYQRAISQDYCIEPGSGGTRYIKYDIYAYHYKPDTEASVTYTINDETYVTQVFHSSEGPIYSDPGGQIFVDGNVVIGSQDYEDMIVKGKLTLVSTGNIWIADPITVYGDRTDGIPAKDNENVLGLIAQGVIKVIDPGLSGYSAGGINYYPGPPQTSVSDANILNPTTHSYVPVANAYGSSLIDRILPDPMIVEAAITVGGGGWGAENVAKQTGFTTYGGRKENPPGTNEQDYLIIVGSITESVRGVVGLVNTDGYIKRYTIDERLLEGVLPGNIWFGGKYVPAPAGWHDYRIKD